MDFVFEFHQKLRHIFCVVQVVFDDQYFRHCYAILPLVDNPWAKLPNTPVSMMYGLIGLRQGIIMVDYSGSKAFPRLDGYRQPNPENRAAFGPILQL